jgi:hypothetical protein
MLDMISNPRRWVSLHDIGMVESERYIDGKTTSETRYFIVSIAPDAKNLLMQLESIGLPRISYTGCSTSHLEKTILESGGTMPLKISVCLDMSPLMPYVNAILNFELKKPIYYPSLRVKRSNPGVHSTEFWVASLCSQ